MYPPFRKSVDLICVIALLGLATVVQPAVADPDPSTPALISPPVSVTAGNDIETAIERGILPPSARNLDPGDPLTIGFFADALKQLQGFLIKSGAHQLTPISDPENPREALSREKAVWLFSRAVLPAGTTPKWSRDRLVAAIPDYVSVQPEYQPAIAAAMERGLVAGPLRPTDDADVMFGAGLLDRAVPEADLAPISKGSFPDEMRRAVSLHLIDAGSDEKDPVTTGQLAKAIMRARDYLPQDCRAELPDLPVDSADPHHLTREDVVSMVVTGLVPDRRLGNRSNREDRDATVVYAIGFQDYLRGSAEYARGWQEASELPDEDQAPICLAAYKGWLPNANFDWGRLRPGVEATVGYAASILARATTAAGDYTGVVIDLSGLGSLERAGGMWVVAAGDDPLNPVDATRIYPSPDYPPLQPFQTAPGTIGYYGDIASAKLGRVGSNPLIIKALDWARYDWSRVHGEPGLRRGGGVAVPLDHFNFVRGTPPLILISQADAERLQQADQDSLVVRKFRVGLVHPNFAPRD